MLTKNKLMIFINNSMSITIKLANIIYIYIYIT
jgi:hypothetical protein